MPYLKLRVRCFHINVLNVLAPTEDKTDDLKDSFFEKLECVFDIFPKYHMKIVLGDFSGKVGKETLLNWQVDMKIECNWYG
jgi:hypothetical protein